MTHSPASQRRLPAQSVSASQVVLHVPSKHLNGAQDCTLPSSSIEVTTSRHPASVLEGTAHVPVESQTSPVMQSESVSHRTSHWPSPQA